MLHLYQVDWSPWPFHSPKNASEFWYEPLAHNRAWALQEKAALPLFQICVISFGISVLNLSRVATQQDQEIREYQLQVFDGSCDYEMTAFKMLRPGTRRPSCISSSMFLGIYTAQNETWKKQMGYVLL